jgi:hypothetical protein
VGCAAAELDVADVDDDADDDDDDDDAVDDLLLLQPPIATPTTIVVAARPAAITEIFIAICSSVAPGTFWASTARKVVDRTPRRAAIHFL